MIKTGNATVDERLEVKFADETFFEFVGGHFLSLVSSTHSGDLPKLRNAIRTLEKGEETMLCYRLGDEEQGYQWMMASVSFAEGAGEGGEELYKISLRRVKEIEQGILTQADELTKDRELFDLLPEYFFTYNRKTNIVHVYEVLDGQTVTKVEDNLEKVVDTFWENYSLATRSELDVENLIRDVKTCEHRFAYDIETAGAEENSYVVFKLSGMKHFSHLSEEMTVGVIRKAIRGAGGVSEEVPDEERRDPGTGVLNKKTITEYARRVVEESTSPVHLCIVDLDNFKMVNDTRGHMFGDEVLMDFGRILKEAVGSKGIVGRIGGDEFMAVIDKLPNVNDLRGILRAMRSNTEWFFKQKMEDLHVTTSIGVVSYPEFANNYEDLFAIADKMLYLAKEKGKNRYVIFNPELHGDVLSGKQVKNAPKPSGNKRGLVCKLMEEFSRTNTMSFQRACAEVGLTYGLDEVQIFYEDMEHCAHGWRRIPGTETGVRIAPMEEGGKPCTTFIHEDQLDSYFDENGVFVVDRVVNIEGLYLSSYEYMNSRGIKQAIIYRMSKEQKEGYVIYFSTNDSARKWRDGDIADLTYIGRIFELAILAPVIVGKT